MKIRFKHIGFLAAVMGLLLTSCKDEDGILNDTGFEAEITQATVAGIIGTPRITDDVVSAILMMEVGIEDDRSALAPIFELSNGADISPVSGSVHDFTSDSVVYIVTSVSGRTKNWTVHINKFGESVEEPEEEDKPKPKPEK